MASPDPISVEPRSPDDQQELSPESVWEALSDTPGIGLSVIDLNEHLIFVNAVSRLWFLGSADADYVGKKMRDFHPDEFVDERMEMINRVVTTSEPMSIDHIYHGRRIESTLWPVKDHKPPYDRVIVVSLHHAGWSAQESPDEHQIETFETKFIDLGPLNVLTKRELEVLALLGHGLNVPQVAKTLHRSAKTIERHKSSISEKLHVSGQAELAMTVTSIGLEVSDAHLIRYRS